MGKLTKRTRSSGDIVKQSLTESHNDLHDYVYNDNCSSKKQNHRPHLPKEILEEVAGRILEHVKQLGLFDEMRMKLLETIESDREFSEIKNEFMREIDTFCNKVDLTLPRNKLRERLTNQSKSKAADWLIKHVQDISHAHKHELKMLYNDKADKFIRYKIANQQIGATKTSITIEEQTKISSKGKLHNEHCKSVTNNNSINTANYNQLSAKTFNGKSLSIQRETNCDNLRKKSKKTLVVQL